jgi:hypothetical protein
MNRNTNKRILNGTRRPIENSEIEDPDRNPENFYRYSRYRSYGRHHPYYWRHYYRWYLNRRRDDYIWSEEDDRDSWKSYLSAYKQGLEDGKEEIMSMLIDEYDGDNYDDENYDMKKAPEEPTEPEIGPEIEPESPENKNR